LGDVLSDVHVGSSFSEFSSDTAGEFPPAQVLTGSSDTVQDERTDIVAVRLSVHWDPGAAPVFQVATAQEESSLHASQHSTWLGTLMFRNVASK
jgi:hypothetical protein